jgi:protoporphyrinogen IX oxidase
MYLWLKAFHIVAVIAWMAGLFYLPRLFVYHADKPVGSETDVLFVTMERRLMAAIMRPASVAVLLSGLGLLHILHPDWSEAWLWMKLAGVLGMFVFHGVLEMHLGAFQRGRRLRGSRYYRILNEVPTVLLVVIVIAVVVRPFA